MFKKFIIVTACLNLLIGLGVIFTAFKEANPDAFTFTVTAGAFVFGGGVLLIWASRDLVNRAPVVFWNGLVRLVVVGALIYGYPNGLTSDQIAMAPFDGAIGLIYVIGNIKVSGKSFPELLFIRTDENDRC